MGVLKKMMKIVDSAIFKTACGGSSNISLESSCVLATRGIITTNFLKKFEKLTAYEIDAIIKIQNMIRVYLYRKRSYGPIKNTIAAIKIQRVVRSLQKKKKRRYERNLEMFLKEEFPQLYRRKHIRKKVPCFEKEVFDFKVNRKRENSNARKIQRAWKNYSIKVKAAKVIQTEYMCYVDRQKIIKNMQEKEAAEKIQTQWKKRNVVKTWMEISSKLHRNKAAFIVQNTWKNYKKKNNAALCIQRCWHNYKELKFVDHIKQAEATNYENMVNAVWTQLTWMPREMFQFAGDIITKNWCNEDEFSYLV